MSDINWPNDAPNREFLKNVFPGDWENPSPAEIYDLVIIGGGPAGEVAVTIAAGFNASVAIVEKEHLGGECLSVGCVPSKALLRSSRAVAAVRDAAKYGVDVAKGWKPNFAAIMERVRGLRSMLSQGASAKRFRDMGADVFLGAGRFTGPETLEVAGRTLRFRKALVAVGTAPVQLSVPGLEEVGYLTNQTVFNLTELPPRLAVIGAGGIGAELGQAFARFGSQVTLITNGERILPREDPDAAERLQGIMKQEGMSVWTGCRVSRVERQGDAKLLHTEGGPGPLLVDEILVAIGRIPAVDGLGLEEAGIAFERRAGITVDENLQTSNKNIYAISSRYDLTNVSKELAGIAVQNALGESQLSAGHLTVPWCTFTDPEIAHVGLTEEEARTRGIKLQSTIVELAGVGRAILDGETDGFVKLHVREGTDELLGATVMAAHAGEMISELTVAMAVDASLKAISLAIHPFPTQAEAIRAAAEAALR